MQGVRIPPIPWEQTFASTSWADIGWQFYNHQGEYVGGGQVSEITANQAKEITGRIANAEAKIARIRELGKVINGIAAENRANPPELFG